MPDSYWAPGTEDVMPVEAQIGALREQMAEMKRTLDNLTYCVRELMTVEQRLRCPVPDNGPWHSGLRGGDQSPG